MSFCSAPGEFQFLALVLPCYQNKQILYCCLRASSSSMKILLYCYFYPDEQGSPLRNSHIVWYCPLAAWCRISLPSRQGFFHLAISHPDISPLCSTIRISQSWSIISRFMMTSSWFYSKHSASPDYYLTRTDSLHYDILTLVWWPLTQNILHLMISQQLPEWIFFCASWSSDELYDFDFWFCLLRNMK